ncbi:MAG: hypothetical protein KIS76_01085 [Pyrinomonadaceae bacterium]|nr:hypothetical protein [Pyrinomonadaceae bacterium]
MKNNFAFVFVGSIAIFLVLGCSSINPFGGSSSDSSKSGSTEKSTADSAIDAVVVEKTGVKECDELSSYLTTLMSSEDEGYAAKATREFIMNRYREAIKESIEKNKENPEKLAKWCGEYKTQLETYKKDEDAKKNAN